MAYIKGGAWCNYHGICKDAIEEGHFDCDAHMADARIFPCPYKNLEERSRILIETHHACSDFQIISEEKKRKYDRVTKFYKNLINQFLETNPKDFEDGGKYDA